MYFKEPVVTLSDQEGEFFHYNMKILSKRNPEHNKLFSKGYYHLDGSKESKPSRYFTLFKIFIYLNLILFYIHFRIMLAFNCYERGDVIMTVSFNITDN